MKNQKGFSALLIVLIVVVLGAAGGAGWYVWHKNQDTKSADTKKTASTQKTGPRSLELLDAKLPAGWTSQIKESGRIMISNIALKCYDDVLVSTSDADLKLTETDQTLETVAAIKLKGYTVIERAASQLTISSDAGNKKVTSQEIAMSDATTKFFQSYGYIYENNSYTHIQLSCDTDANLPAAKAALIAIKIKN